MQNKVLKKATDHFKVALASEMKSIEAPPIVTGKQRYTQP